MKRHFPFVGFCSLPVLVWSFLNSVSAQLPPLRSTTYNGSFSGLVEFPARDYVTNAPMTVEAWIYREDASRCETILSQNYNQSFWFGCCSGSLRFYRSNGAYADADRNVPAHRWTHVAASYSSTGGGQVAFYIDGNLVATKPLAGAGSSTALPLYLGCDPSFGGYRFKGALDEVRLWSVARSAEEIRANRFEELTAAPGLAAAFPQGGDEDIVNRTTVSLPTGVQPQVAGILPRDLVVPITTRTLIADGSPSAEEFEGAEQMVVRYLDGTNEVDTVARLIRRQQGTSTSTNLWVGITFPELSQSFGFDGGYTQLYFDSDNSGDPTYGTNDLRFQYSAFGASPETNVWYGSSGGWIEDSTKSSLGAFKGTAGFCNGEFAPPCVEETLPESWVRALQTNQVRFMMDFYKPGIGIIIPSLLRAAPFNANLASPATWPHLRFGDFADVSAAQVTVRVFVQERLPDGSETGVSGVNVRVYDNRNYSFLASKTTSGIDYASASFFLTMPQNVPLRLEIEPPAGWEKLGSRLSGLGGVAPITNTDWYVIYPGCSSNSCYYQDVFFSLRRPPGPSSFTGPEPGGYWPEVVLRDGPSPKIIDPSLITIEGTNLHSRMSVWVGDGRAALVPSGSMLEPPGPPTLDAQHYWPVPITEVAPDGSSITVRMDVPSTLGTGDFWVRDNWDRPDRDRYWYAAGSVPRTNPPYELLHGFAFDNMGAGHDIDDYRAAFPGMVCDPFKMVGFWAWFPIYLVSLNGNGECVGMCATSDQFSRTLDTEPFNSLVHYAAGFPADDLIPARFNVGNICAPSPQNVWAKIKSNHGVQLSSEFIGETLSQLRFDDGVYVRMSDQFARLSARPSGQVICIRKSLTSSGHALLSLGVQNPGTDLDGTPDPDMRDVVVYDPNHHETRRVLHLNVATDHFQYDGFSPTWTGRILFVHNVHEFWEVRSRNLLSIDTLGATIDRLGARGVAELIAMLVGGEARPMVSFGPGQQLGVNADGTLVETATNAVALPMWSYIPGVPPGPPQLFMEPRDTAPQLDVQVDGKSYAVNTMNMGNMFQLFVTGGRSGDVDQLTFGQDNEQLTSFRFDPQTDRDQVTPKLALAKGGSNYVASLSWEGISVPGGKALGLHLLPAVDGGELDNDTGQALNAQVTVVTPGTSGVRTNQFGPLQIPVGSAQKAILASADGTILKVETDLDRNGTSDMTALVQPGQANPGDQPNLEASILPDNVRVAWKVTAGAWILEESTSLDPNANWQSVGASPAVDQTGRASVNLPLDSQTKFFRLRAW